MNDAPRMHIPDQHINGSGDFPSVGHLEPLMGRTIDRNVPEHEVRQASLRTDDYPAAGCSDDFV